jgi:serine/threonine-protein kinase
VLVAACVALLAVVAAFVLLRPHIWQSALPAQKHVAVIPFTLTGGSPADQATAYGLAESLTGNLSRLQVAESSLWVVPWKEVRNQKPDNISRAAAALGANLLITGQMEKSEGKLRLRATVKDARTLKDLRTQVIDIPEAGMLKLEDTLLERVSAMLQLPVPAGMLRHLPVDETLEPGAYEFYEQGKGYLLHYSTEDVDRAIVLLQKATEKDSKFALAYANLAFAYAWKYRVTRDPQLLEQARTLAGKALALNDKLAPAHVALAVAQRVVGNLDAAAHELELALQLDPTDAETLNLLALTYDEAGRLLQAEALLKDALKRYPGSWVNYNYLGYFYYRHGQFAQAEPLFRTAIELAPDNPISYDNLGGVYLALGKYKEADSLLTRGIAIKPDANGYSNLGTARFYLGRYSDAAAMFQKAAELRPADHRLWRNLGDAYTLAGDGGRAAQAYETARQQLEKLMASRPEDGQLLTVLALYYAKLGQKEKALQKLSQAGRIAEKDGAFFFNATMVYELAGHREQAIASLGQAIRKGYPLAEIRDAHELDPLRKDSRFASLTGGQEAAK